VTALLVANPEIAASLPPFNAMWQSPVPACTKLRQNMRQFVLQSSFDFGWIMNELGIQRDQSGAIIGPAAVLRREFHSTERSRASFVAPKERKISRAFASNLKSRPRGCKTTASVAGIERGRWIACPRGMNSPGELLPR
jgi:hypothetical protein